MFSLIAPSLIKFSSVTPSAGQSAPQSSMPFGDKHTAPQNDVFQNLTTLPGASLQNADLSQSIPPSVLDKSPAGKRFTVIGDAGVGHQFKYLDKLTGASGEDAVANQMMKTFEKKPFASVLTMGDNVYPWGEKAMFDDDIDQPFHKLRDKAVRFYPSLGNHDVNDPTQGGDQLKHWGMPRYYTQHLGNVDIFAIDTTLFFPGFSNNYTKNPEQARQASVRQLEWLDKALAKSTAKYKIVYGHYPLHEIDEKQQSPDNVDRMRRIIGPVLQRNGVDAYLAGHHHAYERTDVNDTEMPDFVSGAGGQLLTQKQLSKFDKTPIAPLKVFIPQRHFMLFEDTPQGLSFQAISENGKILDQGVIHAKPGRQGHEEMAAQAPVNRFLGSLNKTV